MTRFEYCHRCGAFLADGCCAACCAALASDLKRRQQLPVGGQSSLHEHFVGPREVDALLCYFQTRLYHLPRVSMFRPDWHESGSSFDDVVRAYEAALESME